MLSHHHDGFNSEGEHFDLDGEDLDSGPEYAEEDDRFQRVMVVPPADAGIQELRKALSLVQHAYSEAREELRHTKQELSKLSLSIPAKKRGRILNSSDAFDSQIVQQAKKYVMLHHFWAIDSLFPIGPIPPIVDPRSAARWDSNDSRVSGAQAELYAMVPQDMHETMATYKQFGSVFTSALNQERSNILKIVKEMAPIYFAPFGLDTELFSAKPAHKKDDPTCLRLLKKDGVGNYTPLAPVLFADPEKVSATDFLRSPLLATIVCTVLRGKSSLSDQKHGRPKARGEKLDILSVPEGLVAGAAIMARFLLSHDPELSQVGAQTQIKYLEDYEFYLKRLLKRNRWAIDTMDFYNCSVFGATRATAATSPSAQDAVPRTWEDEMLDALDNDDPTAAEAPISSPISRPQAEIQRSDSLDYLDSPPRSPISEAGGVASFEINATSRVSMQPVGLNPVTSSIELSAVAQLATDVAQMSVSNAGAAIAQAPQNR
ncbi:hypothetical protein J3R83DRAFT_5110 [Lanmaoa asiatica]|nr:hypothetical protein J3R83DRAFT_5110 [Lanmaoa asiatica]